jgi:carboxymethylenebutenolidase
LASAGYAVLLVDLYSRAGGTERLAESSGKPVYEAAPIALTDALDDLGAGLDWLKQQDCVSSDQIGVIGFCMGGRLALLVAERRPDVKTSVVYYGILGAHGNLDPLADVGKIKGSLLGHFGEEDRAVPLDSVETLKRRLGEENVVSSVHIYPNAGHAFNNDRNPQSFKPEAAQLAWRRTLDWFREHLGRAA